MIHLTSYFPIPLTDQSLFVMLSSILARHVGDRMYRGQSYVMQMDAHCLFINHWDTKIVTQWQETGNEMAVLR